MAAGSVSPQSLAQLRGIIGWARYVELESALPETMSHVSEEKVLRLVRIIQARVDTLPDDAKENVWEAMVRHYEATDPEHLAREQAFVDHLWEEHLKELDGPKPDDNKRENDS